LNKEIILEGIEKYFTEVKREGNFLLCRSHRNIVDFGTISEIEERYNILFVTTLTRTLIFRILPIDENVPEHRG
jgi:hypothetical protein